MAGSKEYLPDKPPFFEDLKAYVGVLKPELIRCFRYYAYKRHGKWWRKGDEFGSINFLIRSIELNKSHPDRFSRDIKDHKSYYRHALYSLLLLISASEPHRSDGFSLDLVIGFHRDMEKAVNIVARSKSNAIFRP